MKERHWLIGTIAFGMALTVLVSCITNNPALAVAGVLWAAAAIFLLKREQNVRKTQLQELSLQLNRILERQPRIPSNGTEDTLEDKLASQLDKLQSLLQFYDGALSDEQESIKKLITEIAHQLRTPLANMESYLDLCREAATEEELTVYLDAVRVSEQKIAFLIESFIKISRLEHYSIQIKKEKQDLRETILQAMTAVSQEADTRQITLKLLTKSPLLIPHDKNWLQEAVENLLDNSIKYSSAGDVVEISFQHTEMFIRIQVRDYGIGIEPGEESRVFRRFYRGKRVTHQEGFGIGLYLARQIVLRHDGFMKITRKTKGLLVEIYLPQ